MIANYMNKAVEINDRSVISNEALLPVYSMTSSQIILTPKRNRVLLTMVAVLILLVFSIFLSSCFTSGYGCKGKSHLITRVN